MIQAYPRIGKLRHDRIKSTHMIRMRMGDDPSMHMSAQGTDHRLYIRCVRLPAAVHHGKPSPAVRDGIKHALVTVILTILCNRPGVGKQTRQKEPAEKPCAKQYRDQRESGKLPRPFCS